MINVVAAVSSGDVPLNAVEVGTVFLVLCNLLNCSTTAIAASIN